MLTACGRLGFEPASDARSDDASPSAYTTAVEASRPVAYYHLDETTGTTAFDAMPGHHDGFYDQDTATIELGQPGVANRAVRITGDGNAGSAITAVVRIDETLLDWSADFTVELFVQPNQVPPTSYDNAIFVCETYLTDGFRLGWDQTGIIEAWTDEAGAAGTLQTTASIAYGRFDHIALVKAGNRFSLFLDGALAATDPTFDYLPTQPGAECGVGSFHGMPSHGTFDEVAFYDRALPAQELADHASAR